MSNIELIDTHCHLQFDKLAQNPGQVIKSAQDSGVAKLICVGTTLADSRRAIDLAAQSDNVWATVGIHPHDAQNADNLKNLRGPSSEMGKMLSSSKKVVAVGEIGLDYYKSYSPRTDQEKIFRAQIETGLPSGLPFIFHVRDAFADFWRIIDAYATGLGPVANSLRGVIHSFSATQKELEEALSRGLYVALNGIMTFTKDGAQLAAAKAVPKDRLLLETDAPFLTPAAVRGQVCEPKHLVETAKFLAELRGESLEELAKYTTENAVDLFKLK